MVLQKDQLLLRLLRLRVVVNGRYIYALVKGRPVVIDMPTNPARLVITDGLHITEPVEVHYGPRKEQFFTIVCAIEDGQLLAGVAIMAALYIVGATSGLALLQLISMMPVLYFIFLYYIRRKVFLRLRPA